MNNDALKISLNEYLETTQDAMSQFATALSTSIRTYACSGTNKYKENGVGVD